MIEEYYISPLNVTPRITTTVMKNSYITIGESKYLQLSKKPRGKSIKVKFTTTDESKKIIIYK